MRARLVKLPVLGAMICGWLAAGAGVAAADERSPDEARQLRRTPVVEAVERAAPAVVSIGTTRLVRVRRFWEWDFLVQERPGALGSGVIVHPKGYVITNAHVINQAAQIAVKLTGLGEDKEEIPASLIAVDLENDLALLRMEQDRVYPAAEFGTARDLMVGETAIAMGSPFGLGRTVTTGVISAQDRTIRVRDQEFHGLIQTDAAVNQGNSGGALLNLAGEWIGVNSAIFSMSGGSDGIGFAIPIEVVRNFLVEAMRPRRMAGRWIGLEFKESETGVVRVGTVYPVGPAADASVREGLMVVDEDDDPVSDLLALSFAVLDAVESGSFTLRLSDGAKVEEITLAFAELPTAKLAWEKMGVRCAEVTPEITETTGYREGLGVLITEVRKDGPAARIGFQPGDLLVGLASDRVRSLEGLLVGLEALESGDVVDVTLWRRGVTRFGPNLETWKARVVTD